MCMLAWGWKPAPTPDRASAGIPGPVGAAWKPPPARSWRSSRQTPGCRSPESARRAPTPGRSCLGACAAPVASAPRRPAVYPSFAAMLSSVSAPGPAAPRAGVASPTPCRVAPAGSADSPAEPCGCTPFPARGPATAARISHGSSRFGASLAARSAHWRACLRSPLLSAWRAFVDRAAGFLKRRCHGVTVGTGVGTTFSLLMKHIRPLTTPSATWSGCLVSRSRSRLRNPVSMMPAIVFGSISEKA